MSNSEQSTTKSRVIPIDVAKVLVPPEVIAWVPGAMARRHGILPVAVRDDCLDVVSAGGDIDAALMQLEARHGLRVRIVPTVDPGRVKQAIQQYYPTDEISGDTPLGLFSRMLRRALQAHSSDLHIDPQEDRGLVRMRMDGLMRVDQELTREQTAEIVSAVKVAANLDIAEHRIPQDGQMSMENQGETISMRVATVPTIRGEKITVRILASARSAEDLSDISQLGMSPQHFQLYSSALRYPHGIILLSGPTGSGKTTTLYAGLRKLKEAGNLHILTIEDPVEIPLDGITQVRVDSERVSFNRALRSALRHDPDVIMIGEIRDAETADIAVKSALTGHLVLSTVHTNDATGVVVRLLNLGVPRDLLASTLRLAVAQRLVRRPCPHCLQMVPASGQLGGLPAGTLVPKAVGCSLCAETGYAGRIGLYEMLPIDLALREAIMDGKSEAHLHEIGFGQGRNATLLQDGIAKITGGLTTPEEVERVAFLDELPEAAAETCGESD
jgi:type II secretory ATPase GspE/PulE/Tfp pilus assembly ATPase PilB-like protein